MAVRSLRKFLADIMPPWLSREWGSRLVGMAGVYFDASLQGAQEAIQAAWLRSKTIPSDALPILGRERSILRVEPDTDADYQRRCWLGWDLWEDAGTPEFADWVLEPWGIDSGDVYTRAQGPDGWQVGEATADFSRFSVLVADPSPAWTQAIWGTAPATWGSGTTWGSSATSADVKGVYDCVWRYKAGHEVPIMVVLAWGYCWGWGTWGAVGDTWGAHSIYWEMGNYWGGSEAHRHPDVWGGSSCYGSPALVGTRLWF